MKEYLAELVREAPSLAHGRNTAREYLQARILEALQHSRAMIPLAFHGGTALRFLYAHGRYSEDLDFALEQERERYDFRAYLQAIRAELTPEGYQVEFKVNDQKTVHSAFVRFPGLLFELGLSAQRTEVMAVKIEVDTRPPAGARLATTVTRRFVILQLQHHDQASLLAGKLHAILQRPFLKGRDVYDLIWYLSDPNWPPPNVTLLNNALTQTGWSGPMITLENWKTIVRQRFLGATWQNIASDVRPFLDVESRADLLTQETLEQLLS